MRCRADDIPSFVLLQVSSNGKMTICGTDEYMAPEMLFDESFSYPADMFSFGETLAMNPGTFACKQAGCCHAGCSSRSSCACLNAPWIELNHSLFESAAVG